MTLIELHFIRDIIKNIDVNHLINTFHVSEKKYIRHITDLDIKATVLYGKIIEYHYKNKSHRILLRYTFKKRRNSICVVIDIKKYYIITAYCNSYNDNHKTIDMSIYDKSIDILKTFNE